MNCWRVKHGKYKQRFSMKSKKFRGVEEDCQAESEKDIRVLRIRLVICLEWNQSVNERNVMCAAGGKCVANVITEKRKSFWCSVCVMRWYERKQRRQNQLVPLCHEKHWLWPWTITWGFTMSKFILKDEPIALPKSKLCQKTNPTFNRRS